MYVYVCVHVVVCVPSCVVCMHGCMHVDMCVCRRIENVPVTGKMVIVGWWKGLHKGMLDAGV